MLVLNLRFSYAGLADNYNASGQKIGEEGLKRYWPNAWFKPYLDHMPAVYYPALVVGGNWFGRPWGYWIQEPHNYNISAKVSKNAGRHYLKTGIESRLHRMFGIFPDPIMLSLQPGMTADTFLNPDTSLSGDPYATLLLGALDNTWDTYAQYIAAQNLAVNYHGAFVHDDFKLNRRVTLNLGLRYEHESAPTDARDRYTRYLDLTDPIPEMQTKPPVIPGWIDALRGKPAKFNGAWIFSDREHRSPYNAQKLLLLPRAGLALRVNDKTAFQAGYARYIVPSVAVGDQTIGPRWFPGFSAVSHVLPAIAGIPAASLSDPFPAGKNALQLPVGKSLGRYTNLGNSAGWDQQDYPNGVNDRFNFTVQRELPGKFKADVTWFMHFGHSLVYPWWSRPMNMADPSLIYSQKGKVFDGVANPFYNYSTPDKFPGDLRYRETVTVLDLLRP